MALPVTITGINLTVAPGGPYKSSTNFYYFFGRDGTTATTLQAFKATAPDTSWASIATKTGFTTAILNLVTYQVADVVHILVQDGTASTSQAVKYVSFNMANDTFLATTETVSAAGATTGQISSGYGCSIVVRGNGEVVAFYNGLQTKTSGTFRARVYYRRRTAVNTWSTETQVDANIANDNSGPVAVLGAADRVHFAWSLQAGASTPYRTLSAANALSTAGSTLNFIAPSDAVSYDRSGTTKVVFTSGGTAQTTLYFDSADTPSPVNTNASGISGTTAPHRIGADVVTDDVTIVYRDNTSSDLFAIKSSNDGSTFGSPVLFFTGTVGNSDANLSRSPSGSQYTRGSNNVIGYLVNDNGTLKYNEYSLIRAIVFVADKGTFTEAGPANKLAYGRKMPATAYGVALSGNVANLGYGHVTPAAPASFALAGQAAGLRVSYKLIAQSGAFALAGIDVTLSKTTVAGPVKIFITGGGLSFTIPANCTSATVECIGGGGGGAKCGVGGPGAGGAGGGYARRSAIPVTPNSTVSIQVGFGGSGASVTAGNGGFTIFTITGSPEYNVLAQGGPGANGTTRGSAATSGFSGDQVFFGGNGGSQAGGNYGGAGGGGAGGAIGNGQTGGATTGSTGYGGTGGGGASGGGAGGNSPSNNGTAGGVSGDGTPGGAGGLVADFPRAPSGSHGSGGGGGYGLSFSQGRSGGHGGAGVDWDATHGCGGGGGGGGGDGASNQECHGGNGGLYGAGGGGAGLNSGSANGGNGAPGIIVFTYTPVPGVYYLSAATGAFALSGQAAALITPLKLTATTSALLFAWKDATLTKFTPGTGPQVIFITSGTSYTIPANCTVADVECIGGGGGGSKADNSSNDGAGGGGGAYSKQTGVTLTPNASVTIQVGGGGSGTGTTGGTGGDTWFNGTSLATASCSAKGGFGASFSTRGLGGQTTGVGTVKYNGGHGGISQNFNNGASGGGGAGGPGGTGGQGGATSTGGGQNGGAGGGGNGGGGAGATVSGNSGSTGGTAVDSTAGGTSGVAGSHGSGGGGSAASSGSSGAGGAGVEWTAADTSVGGSGGGGGGGGENTAGATGGLYGGGGGGGGFTNANGGSGAPGIIVITYTPAATGIYVLPAAKGAFTLTGVAASLTYASATANKLVTAFTPGADRNDYDGEVGLKFRMWNSTTFNYIGLRRGTSNSGNHVVNLYDEATQTLLRTATISLTGGTVGTFYYAPITSVTLTFGTTYALVHEAHAGDGQWWADVGDTTLRSVSDYWLSTYRPYTGVFRDGTSSSQYVGVDLNYIAGGVAYTLPAATGTFALVGTATRLAAARKVTAAAGSFNLSSLTVNLKRTYVLPAVKGALAFTGYAVTLVQTGSYRLTASVQAFAFAGSATRLAAARILPAALGVFALANPLTALRIGRRLVAVTGVFAFAGSVTRLAATRIMAAAQGSIAFTFWAASLGKAGSYSILASTYALTFNRVAANLLAVRKLPVTVGTFALSGKVTGLRIDRRLTAVTGAIAFTGITINLRAIRKLTAVVGTFALSGTVTGLTRARTMAAATGVIAFSGVAAALRYPRKFTADVGTFTLTGAAASLAFVRTLAAEAGALLLTGNDAGLVYTKLSGIIAYPGSFVLSGQDVEFKVRRLPPRPVYVRFTRPMVHIMRRW